LRFRKNAVRTNVVRRSVAAPTETSQIEDFLSKIKEEEEVITDLGKFSTSGIKTKLS
jgi:hypothetical protein